MLQDGIRSLPLLHTVGIPVNVAGDLGVTASELRNTSFVLSDYQCQGDESSLMECLAQPVASCSVLLGRDLVNVMEAVGVICRGQCKL